MVVLLGSLALVLVEARHSALLGLAISLICSMSDFWYARQLAAKAAVFGASCGLVPIGCIVLSVIFMYRLTCEAGLFKALEESVTEITQDRHLQLLIMVFSFGAFWKGRAADGRPCTLNEVLEQVQRPSSNR